MRGTDEHLGTNVRYYTSSNMKYWTLPGLYRTPVIAALMRSGRLRCDNGPAQGMIVGPDNSSTLPRLTSRQVARPFSLGRGTLRPCGGNGRRGNGVAPIWAASVIGHRHVTGCD